MENNNEVQDFDLDDILSEFLDTPEESIPEVEPDAELDSLLHLPDLTITPVVVKEPESIEAMAEEAAAEAGIDPVVTDDTMVFTPVEETAATEEAEVPSEDTVVLPQTDDTPAAVEPAFEVEEEFIPSPILFTPRSRLKELKKKLVAGPEKRYYELSEIGVGKIQTAILINLILVLLCAGVTTMFTMNMVPGNRMRLVIFSQVLTLLISGLLGSHLMIDSLADLLKGRFSINTLLTLTFGVCLADGVLCLKELRVPCCAAFSLAMTFALLARYQKRSTEISQMDTLRKATRLNGIIKVEDFHEGKPGFLRTDAQVEDFMDYYSKISGPELVQSIYAGMSLIACIALGILVLREQLKGTLGLVTYAHTALGMENICEKIIFSVLFHNIGSVKFSGCPRRVGFMVAVGDGVEAVTVTFPLIKV